jgi:hypothetical protein
MQYLSPPHQHEPYRSCDGWPPCHLCSVPWSLEPIFDCEVNAALSGRKLTKKPNTTIIVSITSAMRRWCPLDDCLLRNELFTFIACNSTKGRLLLLCLRSVEIMCTSPLHERESDLRATSCDDHRHRSAVSISGILHPGVMAWRQQAAPRLVSTYLFTTPSTLPWWSIWREEIGNRNRLVNLAGRNRLSLSSVDEWVSDFT